MHDEVWTVVVVLALGNMAAQVSMQQELANVTEDLK